MSVSRLCLYADEEEEADRYTAHVPYLLETALRRSGAVYFRDKKHTPNVVAEDNLLTAQNAESARMLAEQIVLKLHRMGLRPEQRGSSKKSK